MQRVRASTEQCSEVDSPVAGHTVDEPHGAYVCCKFMVLGLVLLVLSSPAFSITFTVTNGSWQGPGSLRDAINQANANPGKDRVEFSPGVTDIRPTADTSGAGLNATITISDSVDIVGHGRATLKLSDLVTWVTPSGVVNGGLSCDAGNILVANGKVVLTIQGSTNPEVLIKGMTFKQNFGVLRAIDPGRVTFEDVLITENFSGPFQCEKPIIDHEGELILKNVDVQSNRISTTSFRDAIVFVNGAARIESTEFSWNTAGAQFMQFDAGATNDAVIIRESIFRGGHVRVVISGGTAKIANTLLLDTGSSAFAGGIQGFNANIDVFNSTITMPSARSMPLGPSFGPAAGSHVSLQGSGILGLFNTVVSAPTHAAGSPPLVGVGGALLLASPDSLVTDGSVAAASTGSSGLPNTPFLCDRHPKLCFIPPGPPMIDGGLDSVALDPDKAFPGLLDKDILGGARFLGARVDIGASEIAVDYTRDDTFSMTENTILTSAPHSLLDNDDQFNPAKLKTAILVSGTSNGTVFAFNADGTFKYLPHLNFHGTDTFTYRMSSGATPANIATVAIKVTKSFDLIKTLPDRYTTREGVKLEIKDAHQSVVWNDDRHAFIQDVLLGPQIKITSGPAHAAPGSFTMETDGRFVYTPEAGFTGTDSFTYRFFLSRINTFASAETSVSINVIPVNHAPAAQRDSYVVPQDTRLNVAAPALLGNDSDPDGNLLTAVIKSSPAHGTVIRIGPDLVYQPDAGFTGFDLFTYAAFDGHLESPPVVVVIAVSAVNSAPVVGAEKYRLPANTRLSVPGSRGLLRNDYDPDGDPLTAHRITQPANGTLSITLDGGFIYVPNPGFTGIDHFQYGVSDGSVQTIGVTTLIVTPVNQKPIANGDTYQTVEDGMLSVPPPHLLANDTDPEGHQLVMGPVTQPANGVLSFAANGSLQYHPNTGFFGTDTFTYVVNDGALVSDPATVHITVIKKLVNLPPIANADIYTTPEGVLLDIPVPGVLTNDFDPEGHALSATLLTQPASGTLTPVNGGGFLYQGNAGFTGTDSFTYTVSDGHLSSSPATVSITVSAVNHAPVAANDIYSMVEGQTLVIGPLGVLGNDSDPDGDILTTILAAPSGHGLLAIDGVGGFSYTPASGFSGTDSFKYVAHDRSLSSSPATVHIIVTKKVVNLPPLATPDSVTVTSSNGLTLFSPGILSNDTDPEGHELSVNLISPPSHGIFSLISGGGFVYIPDSGFAGSDSFIYRANDGHLDSADTKVTITVIPPPETIPVFHFRVLLFLILIIGLLGLLQIRPSSFS